MVFLTKQVKTLLVQQPELKPVDTLCFITPASHKGFAEAVEQVGGIQTFLFLTAKVSY